MSAVRSVSDVAAMLRKSVFPESGRIPMSVYTDPGIYRLEQDRIFNRTWLYVAHESEVAQPGDFVVREMGERSVIVARGQDGTVRVFLNACRHRGMRLACEDFGSTQCWRCAYHGFSFTVDGEFAGAPFERAAYPEGLDRDELRLVGARTDSYQGLIFATWNPDPESLREHLGALAWYLDIFAGRAEMEIVGPPQRWTMPSAWKLPAENFASDAYHTATAHAFLAKLGLVDTADFGRNGYHVDAGNGHGLGIGLHADDESWFPEELHEEHARRLQPDQLALLERTRNLHGNVFPNLSFLIPNFIEVDGRRVSGMMLRLWQPTGPNTLQAVSFHLVERHAPQWAKDLGRKMYIQTFGASGMFDQDDTENWEMQTKVADAVVAHGQDLQMNYQMGMGKAPLSGFPGPGDVYDGKFSEAAARSFYRRWLDLMTGSTS